MSASGGDGMPFVFSSEPGREVFGDQVLLQFLIDFLPRRVLATGSVGLVGSIWQKASLLMAFQDLHVANSPEVASLSDAQVTAEELCVLMPAAVRDRVAASAKHLTFLVARVDMRDHPGVQCSCNSLLPIIKHYEQFSRLPWGNVERLTFQAVYVQRTEDVEDTDDAEDEEDEDERGPAATPFGLGVMLSPFLSSVTELSLCVDLGEVTAAWSQIDEDGEPRILGEHLGRRLPRSFRNLGALQVEPWTTNAKSLLGGSEPWTGVKRLGYMFLDKDELLLKDLRNLPSLEALGVVVLDGPSRMTPLFRELGSYCKALIRLALVINLEEWPKEDDITTSCWTVLRGVPASVVALYITLQGDEAFRVHYPKSEAFRVLLRSYVPSKCTLFLGGGPCEVRYEYVFPLDLVTLRSECDTTLARALHSDEYQSSGTGKVPMVDYEGRTVIGVAQS